MNTKGSGTCLRGNKYVDALRHWAVLPPPKPLKIAKGSAAKQQAVVLERYPTITSEQWWSWWGRTICALLTVVLILLPLFAASPTPWGSLVTTIHSPVKDGSKVYVGIDEACDLLQQHCGEFSPNDLGPLHRQEDSSVHVVKRKTSSKSTGGFKFTNPFKRKKKQRKSGGGEADEEDALASYVANHLGAPALFIALLIITVPINLLWFCKQGRGYSTRTFGKNRFFRKKGVPFTAINGILSFCISFILASWRYYWIYNRHTIAQAGPVLHVSSIGAVLAALLWIIFRTRIRRVTLTIEAKLKNAGELTDAERTEEKKGGDLV